MIRKISLLVVVAFFINGCCCTPIPKPTIQYPVKHIVFVWLKEPGNAVHREKVIETSYSFEKIPGVKDVDVGEVIKSDRKIVDDSFDVGITLSFATESDMKAYLVHPRHKEAVKNVLKPLVRKIVVYDYRAF